MITIGTVKFDFTTDNEPFAHRLNGNWDSFFSASFEKVVDEVLSVYDLSGQMITIDQLSLDMGKIAEDEFEYQFPLRLREALEEYVRIYLSENAISSEQIGIRKNPVGETALDILCFFLLHGYLPYVTDPEYTDIHFLLSKVMNESSYRFREFLESYGHYDFLCQRLVYSYSDEELERIVEIVQPSESKFIHLYVRVQIRSYESFHRPDIRKEDYRNVLWKLVLAYLFAESHTRFSRKQIIIHTLRGLSAHFNFTFFDMTRLLTESIRDLEQKVEQLPELWSLLKEIRQDVKTEFQTLDGDYRSHLVKEILAALRLGGKGDLVGTLSYEHLVYVLSDSLCCRNLLRELQELQIYLLIGIIIPSEKDYILSYARLLDHHKESGTLTGKSGSEFRILKWEFIFAVLLSAPISAFNRKYFVLGVLQRLAAHYNLSITELIRFLLEDIELRRTYLSSEIFPVLQELNQELNPSKERDTLKEISYEDWRVILSIPEVARKFISEHTEQQIRQVIIYLSPTQGEFIINYAALLEKGYSAGLLEGKAGGEFHALKWEFILSCFFYDKSIVSHQKYFVYFVLKQLAAHYNQNVVQLIGYFLNEFTSIWVESSFSGLKTILKELYEEHLFPLNDVSMIRTRSAKELEQWAVYLFGENRSVSGRQESYQMKWLVYFLEERSDILRTLWKEGRLDIAYILQIVNRTPALRHLWLRRIGDSRLLEIYRRWLSVYSVLKVQFGEFGFLDPIAEYMAFWMVELTARPYLGWSETEIVRFLTKRIRYHIPPGYTTLLDKVQWIGDKDMKEIIDQIKEFKKENEMEKEFTIENAGLVLLYPFLWRAFKMNDWLADGSIREFKNDEFRIRAIFFMQYLVYGKEEQYSEMQLMLNKVIVGGNMQNPLPGKLDLTDEEKRIGDSLIEGVKGAWDKLQHTSTQALRSSFLQRKGKLTDNTAKLDRMSWILKVEGRAYDVLLDSFPWNYKIFPLNDNNYVRVDWR